MEKREPSQQRTTRMSATARQAAGLIAAYM